MVPFYTRLLRTAAAERRAREFAKQIANLPTIEQIWRIAWWGAEHGRADLTLRVEFLIGLTPEPRYDRQQVRQ